MDGMIELRCKYCGAPLDRESLESESPYVTCPCCGTSQQRVDAKAYMDQMMGQIQSWISKAIPGGFSITQQENVDPIARHNIYMNNVKPVLDLEMNEYRFALNSTLSSPLIVLPFTKGDPARSKHTSAQAFEFNAKLKSLEPLAVDAQNKKAIMDAEGLSTAYALIVNNSKMLMDTTPGRFTLMSNNFRESSDALKKCDGYDAVSMRLNGLAEVCAASEMILNGDNLGCLTKAEQGAQMLATAKTEILKNPRLAMTLRAIDLEIEQTQTLIGVAGSSTVGDDNPLHTLETINRITSVPYPDNRQWSPLLNRDDRNGELQEYMGRIMNAKSGGTLPICSGDGDILVPFWDVDLKYSFTTGGLFNKKCVEVSEDILVPAIFTLSSRALDNPCYGVTDIFSAVPEKSIIDRFKGNEDSISGGAGIGRLAESASENQIGSRKVMVPLSTKTEAMRLVDNYMRLVSSNNSKLKLSKPFVKRLIYIPCRSGSNGPVLPEMFGKLVPAVMQDPCMANTIVIE